VPPNCPSRVRAYTGPEEAGIVASLTVGKLECPGCGAPVVARPGEAVACRYCAASLLVTWVSAGDARRHWPEPLSGMSRGAGAEELRGRIERLSRQRADFAREWCDLEPWAVRLNEADSRLASARHRERPVAVLAWFVPLPGAVAAVFVGAFLGAQVALAALLVLVLVADRHTAASGAAHREREALVRQYALRLAVHSESLAHLAQMDRDLMRLHQELAAVPRAAMGVEVLAPV
jgi:hypothetical protein